MDEETQVSPAADTRLTSINVEEEMKNSYIDYSMSVIVARALPDARDGFKPVHRRVLYSMHENKNFFNAPYRKCARVVGDVMGKYHPHGDSSIYDTLVRLAQWFSMREKLVDGHGNFGTIDGDGAAAYRYTEARLAKISNEMLADIDKDTVDFIANYDNTTVEPRVETRSLITIDGVQVAAYNTHLDYTDATMPDGTLLRLAQMQFVYELMLSDPCPYQVLTGDFNVGGWDDFAVFSESDEYALANNAENPIPSYFTDGDKNKPAYIDNIIYTKNTLELVNVHNTDSDLSDHLMLTAVFKTK